MQILGLILLGLVVGFVAKLLMPGKDPGGLIITVLLGIAGSLVGGLVSNVMDIAGGSLTTFIMAVIGAMLLLFLYRLFRSSTAPIS